MRKYKNLPKIDSLEFNQYLRDNNILVLETEYWILIRNSYIDNELVCFIKSFKRYLYEADANEIMELFEILKTYKKKGCYINADNDKSVGNRLHLHIKL